jgi:hypothetical protein
MVVVQNKQSGSGNGAAGVNLETSACEGLGGYGLSEICRIWLSGIMIVQPMLSSSTALPCGTKYGVSALVFRTTLQNFDANRQPKLLYQNIAPIE